MATISELLIKIGADNSGLTKALGDTKQQIDTTFKDVSPLNEMQGALTSTTGKVEALLGSFTKFAAVAAGGFGLTSLISSSVEAGESLYQLQRRLGVTTAEAGQFKKILALTGGDADMAGTAIMRLDKTLTGSGEAAEKANRIFDALGVTMKDQEGRLLTLDKQLEQLSEGYKKAEQAGYGQEFIMNTLGARGLGLVQTLRDYAEAKENAAKIQSNGLINPEEMHQLDQEMKIINMQLGQLKSAGGAALAPLAKEFLPEILSGLSTATRFIAQNKEEIKDVTKTVFELIAVYKSLQAIQSIGSKVGSLAGSFMQNAKEEAAHEAKEAALTAQQEKAIEQRIKNIERQALAEDRAYAKTVAKMEISEAEKSTLLAEATVKRTTAVEAAAERERAIMTAMFTQINAQREASTAQAVDSYNIQATAAADAAARIAGANTSAAASSNEIVAANTRAAESEMAKGNAAAIAGERKVAAETVAKAATAETTVAIEAKTVAETASGNAAVIAGEKKVGAETAAKAAIVETTVAQGALTAANVGTGVAAAGTLATIEAGCVAAATKVQALTATVYGLAGGWMAVAAAMAYVGYKMAQGMEQRKAETYTYNGTEHYYDPNTGRLYHYEDTDYSSERSSVNDTTQYWGDSLGGGRKEVEDDVNGEDFQSAWWERHKNDEDYQAQLKKEAAEEETAKLRQQLLEANPFANIDKPSKSSSGGGSAKSASAPKPVTYEETHPIGELAATIAMNNFSEGQQWMGNLTSDSRIQCDSFTANIYAQAGIGDIGGHDTSSQAINDAAFRDAGAYHSVNDGYAPEAGDLVDSAHHVGIYMGNGKVRSRDSSGGVTTWDIDEWDRQFGITGYGSIREATGGMTTTEQVMGTSEQSAEARKADEARRKLEQAKRDAMTLYQSMQNTIRENTGTEYENDMAKAQNDIIQKQLKINQLAQAGVPAEQIEKLRAKLTEYGETITEKVEKKWREAFAEMRDASQVAMAESTHDFEAQAELEYQVTIRKLKKEREAKEKDLMKDKDDYETRHTISNWYYAEVSKAEDKRREARREAHEKYIEWLQEEGNLAMIIANLGSKEGEHKLQRSIDIEGQKKLAKEYVTLWREAHGSMAGYIADVSDSMYSNLSDSMADFIRGTKSAKNVLLDFGNSVLNMMAKIAAQRLAASWMTGLLGAFGGGSSGFTLSNGTSLDPSFGYTGSVVSGFKFAKGGIVTAPTMAMIGEAGENEAVIPLNAENLAAIGGKGKGGNVTVNITNNTGSKVDAEQTTAKWDGEQWVVGVVLNAVATNQNGIRSMIKGVAST